MEKVTFRLGSPEGWSLMIYLFLTVSFCLQAVTGKDEYCQFETFNATCQRNQVVLMDQALYGRMYLGRCVSKEYGHIGCSANVQDLMDQYCSGRASCEMGVPQLSNLIQPCPKDLKSFLEASYSCLNVERLRCNQLIKLNSTKNHMYISKEQIQQQNDPTAKCAIHIQSSPGQQLRFVLYSFGYIGKTGDIGKGICSPMVSFMERGDSGNDISQCDITKRDQSVFLSKTNQVAVDFHRPRLWKEVGQDPRHVLKVEVIGCPDLEAPPNAWVERHSDKAVVRCNHTKETWYVTCTGNRWTGHVTNCTSGSSAKNHVSEKTGEVPIGLVVAVTIGVILGVMFGIAMLITVFVYRKRNRPAKKTSKTTSLLGSSTVVDEASQDNEENYVRRVWIEHKNDEPYGRICRGHNPPPSYSSAATDYSHMFELQCASRTHAHTVASDYHIENPYGQCTRHLDHSGEDLSGVPVGTCRPSFATFKAQPHPWPHSPNKSILLNTLPRQELRPMANLANKNHSLSSVDEIEEALSPDHQPDLVTSSNAEPSKVSTAPNRQAAPPDK